MPESAAFAPLQGHQYISLTTYRKSGEAVATPVWFALDGDCLYIVTQQDSGKVKRIRNTPRVTLAPSDGQGKVRPGAPQLAGTAALLPAAQSALADRALKGKYGWMYSAFGLFWRLRRVTPVYLEVRPAA